MGFFKTLGHIAKTIAETAEILEKKATKLNSELEITPEMIEKIKKGRELIEQLDKPRK